MKYRELHPIKEGKRKWRFLVTQAIKRKLIGTSHRDCQLFVKGKLIAEILSNHLYIYAGYAWNGCSPKRYIGWPPFGMWVGTPDFEATIIASLVHDVLYQFAALLEFTFDEANMIFFNIMTVDGLDESLTDIYHGAVKKFGKDYWAKEDPTLAVIYL
jgi:hypothetical protein